MRANDDIPHDEMLLAEAIAATEHRGFGWTSGAIFRDGSEWEQHRTPEEDTAFCCAIGGLILAGHTSLPNAFEEAVGFGNDDGFCWSLGLSDDGESLGWAYRCAMEEP